MVSVPEYTRVIEDAARWRQLVRQPAVTKLFDWDTEQWATALEWYQPHTPIAPTTVDQALAIKRAYVKRFGRDPAKVATTMLNFIRSAREP